MAEQTRKTVGERLLEADAQARRFRDEAERLDGAPSSLRPHESGTVEPPRRTAAPPAPAIAARERPPARATTGATPSPSGLLLSCLDGAHKGIRALDALDEHPEWVAKNFDEFEKWVRTLAEFAALGKQLVRDHSAGMAGGHA